MAGPVEDLLRAHPALEVEERYRAMLREGRARGFAHFQLWTQANNRRAQRLYEGIGFRRSGREKVDDLDELIVHYEYNPPIAM